MRTRPVAEYIRSPSIPPNHAPANAPPAAINRANRYRPRSACCAVRQKSNFSSRGGWIAAAFPAGGAGPAGVLTSLGLLGLLVTHANSGAMPGLQRNAGLSLTVLIGIYGSAVKVPLIVCHREQRPAPACARAAG